VELALQRRGRLQTRAGAKNVHFARRTDYCMDFRMSWRETKSHYHKTQSSPCAVPLCSLDLELALHALRL